MGLNLASLVQTAVSTVNNAIDGAVETVSYYQRNGASVYDPVSDSYTDEWATPVSTKSIWTAYRGREIDGQQVKVGDYKVLIAAAELGVVPTLDDKIVLSGKTWNVKNKSSDPAKALWKLHVRAEES